MEFAVWGRQERTFAERRHVSAWNGEEQTRSVPCDGNDGWRSRQPRRSEWTSAHFPSAPGKSEVLSTGTAGRSEDLMKT